MTTRLVGLVAAVVLLGVSCGIPTDSEPRALDVSADAATTPTPTTAPLASETVTVYLLDESVQDQPRVQPVQRQVEQITPEAVIGVLIGGPDPDLDGRTLVSAITNQTVLLSAEAEGDVLVVDFQSQVEGTFDLPARAVAQLVYTADELDGIERLRIQVDGDDVSLLRGDGSATSPGEAVTVADYARFDPDTPLDPTPTPMPTPTPPEPTPTLGPAPTATPAAG